MFFIFFKFDVCIFFIYINSRLFEYYNYSEYIIIYLICYISCMKIKEFEFFNQMYDFEVEFFIFCYIYVFGVIYWCILVLFYQRKIVEWNDFK